MTEEESIETLKSWLEYNKKHKNILREADKIIAVQETILNLIQKLQEEKEIHIKLEQQYKKEYLDTREGAKEKDKIIKLMVEELINQFSHYEPCCLEFEMECKKYKTCKDCIIQYFKNKAKEG